MLLLTLFFFLSFLVQNVHQKECQNSYSVWEVSPEDEEAMLQVKKLFQLPPGESILPTPTERKLQGGKKEDTFD